VTNAGLYKGLSELKASLDRLRNLDESRTEERSEAFDLIKIQAEQLELNRSVPAGDPDRYVAQLTTSMLELEYALIPHGLHVAGRAMDLGERREMLAQIAEADEAQSPAPDVIDAIADFDTAAIDAARGGSNEDDALIERLVRANANLAHNRELDGLITALDAIAMVLWGTDNLKTEGGPIAQALALIGAKPRLDSYGRVCGAELMPLEELGRPRIDVVMTLSGHLPRPVAVADQDARRGVLIWPRPPTSRSSRTSSASTRWPTNRPSTAVTWRPRRCGSSATPTALTAPTSTT
jgi:magnesium chelatase subunit H